jgi:hypothetical protein
LVRFVCDSATIHVLSRPNSDRIASVIQQEELVPMAVEQRIWVRIIGLHPRERGSTPRIAIFIFSDFLSVPVSVFVLVLVLIVFELKGHQANKNDCDKST